MSDSAHDLLKHVNPDHVGLLTAACRAPSAHNAQPWRIRPKKDGQSYELHYDNKDYLPEDPDDRDAYLTMGAFTETLVLEAPNYGYEAQVTPRLRRHGDDLFVAEVRLVPRKASAIIDPLSKAISRRHMNRNGYTMEPLTPELVAELKALGNSLLEPAALRSVLAEASQKSWANPRFVRDLHEWYRPSLNAPDGFSSPLMHISKFDTQAMKLVFRKGSLKSHFMQWLFSTRDIGMFMKAPTAAVLAADDMTPASLFEAGRRLLRSWTAIAAAGYACHPFSIAIDEKATAPKVAAIAGVKVPVAMYRIGKTDQPPRVISNRHPLADRLLPPTD